MRALILLSVVVAAFATQECGPNSHFESCGTACPLTCRNYNNPPKVCILRCDIGCQCDEGYVKTDEGRCIAHIQCPIEVPPTETNCVDKPDSGMCLAYVPSYYYDPRTGKCEKFIYGGCQGNGNRYPTEEACLEKCSGIRVQNSSDSSVCDLPAETGVCRGFFPRFHFDRTTGQCQKFVYGGCGGNENNFQTVEECQTACGVQASENVCSLPAKVGHCYGYFPRYYHNAKTGKCQEFIYGGCGGNENNFQTIEECQQTCASAAVQQPFACREPKYVGRCRAHLIRYYFNQETGKCEEFVYGGCDGHSNNFNTLEDCRDVCENYNKHGL